MDFAAINDEHGEIDYPFVHYVREYLLAYPALFVANRVVHVTLATLTIVPAYLMGVATDVVTTDSGSFSLLFVPSAWLPSTQADQLVLTVALLAVVTIVSSLINAVDILTQVYLEELSKHDLRTDAFDATQRLGMEFFDSAQTGNLMNVLNNDIQTYSDAYKNLLNSSTWLAVRIVGPFVVMVLLHWQFTLILVGLLLPIVGISRAFDNRISTKHADVRTYTGRLNARIENAISGIATVKTTANEAYERDRVRTASRNHRDASWAVSKTRALFMPATGLFTNVAAVVTFVLGGWWAATGPPAPFLAPLTLGTLVTFFYYSRSFSTNVESIVSLLDTYRNFRAAAERVHGLFAAPTTVPEATEPVTLRDVDGRVEYDSVTFTYAETETPALRDVSFEVEPGDFVGVAGPTGAGKSTLLKLLLRFYDPDRGVIHLDGQDVRDVEVASLREQIGYVSQEPILFGDTVRENIAYANRDADKRAVVKAAKRANAHEFITDLDDGYDTLIGERGVKLSGGQRQRVAIARAILKDPPILILDEATSHVDNQTELVVQAALEEVTADRTTFAIAHSLSTVRNADQMLVFENSELVETGTHEELVDADGLYRTLWAVHVGDADEVFPHLTEEASDD